MQVHVREIQGISVRGLVLDQHSLGSIRNGYHANGHAKFDTEYTEAGYAVNQLKYHGDFDQVPLLAKAVHRHLLPFLGPIDIVVPMAASTPRPRQPVNAVAAYIATMIKVPVHKKFLVKRPGSQSLKDLTTREEKDAALRGRLSLAYDLPDDDAPYNVLLVDDLVDTGASIDAACHVLQQYEKIDTVYVAALTWRRPR